jgi:hypothetical protein
LGAGLKVKGGQKVRNEAGIVRGWRGNPAIRGTSPRRDGRDVPARAPNRAKAAKAAKDEAPAGAARRGEVKGEALPFRGRARCGP